MYFAPEYPLPSNPNRTTDQKHQYLSDRDLAFIAAQKINAMVRGLTDIGCDITHQQASDIYFELYFKK